MSKIENICKEVTNLPKTSANANVFMLDDFSGQLQGSWSDKKIIWSKMFKELKEAKWLPEKSNLVTDFWVFTEEWIKEIHKKDPKQFPATGKEFTFGEKKEIFKAYLKGHPEYTNGRQGRFGHITLLPAVVNVYGSLVMDLSRYNLLNTRDYSDDSLFIALDEGGYAYDYKGNILIKSMKDLRTELYEKQEAKEYWGSYYPADQWEYSRDMRELVPMKYDWELSEEELKLFSHIREMDNEFDLKTREESNYFDDIGDGYRSFVNSEGETVPAGRSKAWRKLHYATLPLDQEEYDFQIEVLKAQLQFEAEHPDEELWTRKDAKVCGCCGEKYFTIEDCCPYCGAINHDRHDLFENVGLTTVWDVIDSLENERYDWSGYSLSEMIDEFHDRLSETENE